MPTLHIFNPETDYALALDSHNFTPTADIVALRRKLALLPAKYAKCGDAILLLDFVNPEKYADMQYHEEAKRKEIKIITLQDALRHPDIAANYTARPWGWNRNIRSILTKKFEGIVGMPSETEISNFRNLAHRRTTISFLNHTFPHLLHREVLEIPLETDDISVAMQHFRKSRNIYFKAPWSSSGRGVLYAADLEELHVHPWVKGIIARQGSVMIEKGYARKLDFATEWWCNSSAAQFLGFSVFEVSRRGKYHSNVEGSQSKLEKIIQEASPYWNHEILDLQKEAIECIIAPQYDGPLGIDMLITTQGTVHPCVEINLRHTMGMINLI